MASRKDRGTVLSTNKDIGRYLQTDLSHVSKSDADFVTLSNTVGDLVRPMFTDVHAFIKEKEFIDESTKAWLPSNPQATENLSSNERRQIRRRLTSFFTKLGRLAFSKEVFDKAIADEDDIHNVEEITPAKVMPSSSRLRAMPSVKIEGVSDTFSPSPKGIRKRLHYSSLENVGNVKKKATTAATAENALTTGAIATITLYAEDMCAFLNNSGSYDSFTSNVATVVMQYAHEHGCRAQDVGFDILGQLLKHERNDSRT